MNQEQITTLIRTAFSSRSSYPPDEVIRKIENIAIVSTIDKNSIILNLWEEQREVYLIYRGIARSYYLDQYGNDITKSFMVESDFCLGESLFDEGRSMQIVEAIEPIVALKFHTGMLKDIILNSPYLTRVYLGYLEKVLIYKMKRESSFQMMSATERYVEFLKDYKKVECRVNQSYITSYLGITPESLSRIKRSLKD